MAFLAVEGSVFGLMGLLIAFTFSSAAARVEMRRQLIVQETSAISTAWHRIELLPAARQAAIREHFRQYVDNHLAIRDAQSVGAAREVLLRARALQGELWSESVSACREAPLPVTSTLFLPSLNSMIEMVTARAAAAQAHLPLLVRALLIILPVICSLIAGLGSAGRPHRSWVHLFGFATILAITVFVILDLEYPRVGLIRLDSADASLVELRQSMNAID
jgi:hypothetical protein